MSKVNAVYHVVFCTKYREDTINLAFREDVYQFIWSIVRNSGCKLVRIGGTSNHIHMLIKLPPTLCLSDVVRNIKTNSSGWMRSDSRFPDFKGWAKEYFAETVSPTHKATLVGYIDNQLAHHNQEDFTGELERLCVENGLDTDYPLG